MNCCLDLKCEYLFVFNIFDITVNCVLLELGLVATEKNNLELHEGL